jgi:peptide deformylase
MDHLLGKVFVEYLSPLKRNRIKAKMVKEVRGLEREAALKAAGRRY